MDDNADKLKLQYLTGGSLIKSTPIFSSDGSRLLVVKEKTVEVYSVATGECTLILEGANDPIISLEFDLNDNDIIVACTEKGEVIRWKWSTGVLRRRIQIALKNVVIYHTFNLLNMILNGDKPCALVTVVKKGQPVQYFIVNSFSGKVIKVPLDLKLKRSIPLVDVSKGKLKYFVICQGNFVFIVNYETWKWRKLSNRMNKPITLVKVHPTEEAFATGDVDGQITIWRNFFMIDDDVVMTKYHWHHTHVVALAFTPTGATIFSGASETVLVKWDMLKSDVAKFVPRMTSNILHIAINDDNSSLAVCTADNGIQILGVDLKTKCVIQNFAYANKDKTEKEMYPVGLRINPRKQALVLNGRTGHLQFFSAYTKTLMYSLDIVQQNLKTSEEGKINYNTRVTKVGLNMNWMTTAEEFNDEQHLPEVRLKFWEYNEKAQNYILNTVVELPHEGGIKAIEFSNQFHVENLICATVGYDNIIKIWQMETTPANVVWYCCGEITYRNLSIDSIGFSEDGSLLAAGFGNTLCVYKSSDLKLLTALVPGGSFDGCLHKAQVRVPKTNRNGSKNDLNTERQKIIKLFSNLLHTNDEYLLKEIKNTIRSRKIQPIQYIDVAQKQLLYKKIQSMNQLNLFQKLSLYQRLGIKFQLAEEWYPKMVEYIKQNTLSREKCKDLNKQVRRLNLKTRFKAKYKIDKFVKRKFSYEQNVANKLAPILSLIKANNKPEKPDKPLKSVLTNGVDEKSEEMSNSSRKSVIPLQSLLQIKKVLFCYGDFAHLVIVCTENRLLIWNLLSLRLQTVLKLSTDQIAIDPKTNLVSVFTTKQELYVFSPSDTLTLYYRQNMPNILGAVWLARKQPTSQAFLVNWQSRSTLYFLTEEREIMYLAADDELKEEKQLAFANVESGSTVKYTPFGTFATKQIKNTQNTQGDRPSVSMIGVHGKAAVKSFLEMPSHTMAPLSLLCNDFLKSVIKINLPPEEKKSKTPKNVAINGLIDDSSDDDEDFSARKTLTNNSAKKSGNNQDEVSEEYLQTIAAETIEIEF